MRADSPRLPGGGGTSAPSSGGGHVGPGHVIRRRNALGVKVHGRAGGGACVCVRADPGQETAAGLATGRPAGAAPLRPLPRPPEDSPPQLGRPPGASRHAAVQASEVDLGSCSPACAGPGQHLQRGGFSGGEGLGIPAPLRGPPPPKPIAGYPTFHCLQAMPPGAPAGLTSPLGQPRSKWAPSAQVLRTPVQVCPLGCPRCP